MLSRGKTTSVVGRKGSKILQTLSQYEGDRMEVTRVFKFPKFAVSVSSAIFAVTIGGGRQSSFS